MTATVAIVRTTIRQVAGLRRLIGLGLLALLPALVMALSSDGSSDAAAFRTFHEAPMIIMFLIVLPIVSLVMGASTLGDERRDHTLSFLTLRPLRRESIAAAKLLGAWLPALFITAGGGAISAAVLGIRSGAWEVLGPTIVAAAVSSLAYVGVFMVLGHITSRAVLIGLAYLFIWESGISFAADSLATVSLFRIGLSAYVGLVPDAARLLVDQLGGLTPGAGGAIFKAVVIGVLAIGFAALLLRRRDAM